MIKQGLDYDGNVSHNVNRYFTVKLCNNLQLRKHLKKDIVDGFHNGQLHCGQSCLKCFFLV